MESKELILKLLWICLQETRACWDITGIELRRDNYSNEFARIRYQNGFHKDVNVTADSGLAMIHSVVEALY